MKYKTAKNVLGKTLIELIKAYKVNRDNQGIIKWDKEGDLNNISKEIKKNKEIVGYEACCGTFVFHLSNGRNIKVSANSYNKPKYNKERSLMKELVKMVNSVKPKTYKIKVGTKESY